MKERKERARESHFTPTIGVVEVLHSGKRARKPRRRSSFLGVSGGPGGPGVRYGILTR